VGQALRSTRSARRFAVQRGDGEGDRRRFLRFCAAFWLIGCLSGVVRAAEAKFPFKVYTVNDGLIQSTVYAMRQDRLGYLWIGSQAGVSRFDGREFVNFDSRHGLSHNVVRAILLTREGQMVFGAERGLCRFTGQGFVPYGDQDGQPEQVRDLAQAPDGVIWGASYERGIFRVVNGAFEYFGKDAGLPSNRGHAVAIDEAGRVWAGLLGGGLALWENGAWRVFDPEEYRYDPYVRTLYVDRDGSLLVGANRGVYRVANGEIKPYGRVAMVAKEVNALARDGDGRLWVGTSASGAIRWDGETLERFNTARGLPSNTVLSILLDKEGCIWFGSHGSGLARLAQASFLSYVDQRGFTNANVTALLEDSRGNLWLGTNGGGVSQLAGNVFTNYTSASGLVDDRVLSIFEDRDGAMWFGAVRGATRLVEDRFFPFGKAQGLPDGAVYDILQDREGRMWFAMASGAAIYDGTRVELLDESNGLTHHHVRCFVEGRDGAIWIGAETGLSVYRDGRVVRVLTEADGLIGDFINHLSLDGKGRVWAATSHGLIRFEGDRVFNYGIAEGLSSPICNVVIEDRQDVLWVGATNGLNRFNGRSFTLYTFRDGLPSNEINRGAGLLAADGRLWFGSTAGVAVFQGGAPGPTLPAPLIHFTDFRVMGQRRDLNMSTSLPHDRNSVEIFFNAVSLADAGNLKFTYKLEGADVKWRQASSNAAVYNSLPPGDYRFLARARNSDGVWSEEAALSFSILPPIWKRPWFSITLTVLAAMLIALRFRAINRRAAQLEAVVAKRTLELKQKNEALERLALEDQLTGARNRHYLNLVMPNELSRLKRYYFDSARGSYRSSATLGVALLDLDHFKLVNDQYGHDVGDEALIWMAQTLKRFTRETDTVIRWGGEEFLIVFEDISFNDLLDLCERLRRHIASREMASPSETPVRMTVSIGFSVFPLDLDPAEYDWRQIVKLADSALYEAKLRGRNRVVGFNGRGRYLSEVFDIMENRPAELPEKLQAGFYTLQTQG